MKRSVLPALLTLAILCTVLAPSATADFTPTNPNPQTPGTTMEPTVTAPAPVPQVPTAYASTQSVDIDGTAVTFQMYALKDGNGNPTNYVKLRDIASALNGSTVQFNVGWDGNVNIEAKSPYIPNGTEMYTPYSGDRPYTFAAATTNINGMPVELKAIYLADDNGGGYTYYQLRDLGAALGFTVGWTAERGVYVETPKPYITTTLARIVLDDPTAQLTMDNNKQIIYYDASKNSILSLNPLTNQASVMLDAATVTYDDGLNSYEGITVKQVFWDNVANRLIISGTFGSPADGWTVGDGTCEGLFILENGSLTKLCDWPYLTDISVEHPFNRLGAALGNGNFLAIDTDHFNPKYNRLSGLFDPYTAEGGKQKRVDTQVGANTYYFSVGSTLYRAGTTNRVGVPAALCRWDFTTNTWVGVGDPAIGISCYDGEYLYSWAKSGAITAIRPSDGAYQSQLTVTEDVEARDALPIPKQPDCLFALGNDRYVFYDGESNAIRMIVPNPDLVK